MSLVACGINHHTAPLVIREKFYFAPEQMSMSLLDLIGNGYAHEAAILSTCNRTEVYCGNADADSLILWLIQRHQLAQNDFVPYLYIYKDQDAVRHMMRVASGIDSMVIGEPEIFGQMKTAFSVANMAGTIGAQLRHLFEYIFAVTKNVRTNTAIGTNRISLASVGIDLAKKIFTDLASCQVLFIGAGDTIELVARHFYEHGVRNMVFANRTVANAERLTQYFGGKVLSIGDMHHHLAEADIVVAATASTLPLLGKGSFESALKTRKHRPMFLLDLAVPRDIEPEVKDLADVYLYTLDDLQAIMNQGIDNRKEAVQHAEKIIELQTEHYMRHLRSLDANAVIRSYREKMTAISQQELNKALRLLQNGETPEKVLESLSHALSNKLMHNPCAKMRQAAYNGEFQLLNYAKQLFDLEMQ